MKFVLIIPFVIASVFWNSGVSCCLAREKASGELKLEGKHIDRLILQGKDGKSKWFDKPGETIELPAGQYQLWESRLDGGYVCVQGAGIENKWVTIAENKPAVLKVGAPLVQTLQVGRQGKALVLEYKLYGVGGEGYARADGSAPPGFKVYRDDQEIASGQLAYG